MKRLVLAALAILWGLAAAAGEVTVAVASNFLSTAEDLAARFESETGHGVTLVHGATGQIYAQIVAGAPFDIFLAADEERPALLLGEGDASRVRTYALGRLVAVSRVPLDRKTAAEAFAGRTVALADPTVAPYGQAATRAMEGLRLDTAGFRPVLVANVGQVAAIFQTGNADIAFVAAAQLGAIGAPHVLDLEGLYGPVRQDAALLARAEGNAAAAAFWDWLFLPATQDLIEIAGYGRPG